MCPEGPSSAIIVSRPQVVTRIRQHLEGDAAIVVFDASERLPPLNVVASRAQMMLLVGHTFAELPAGYEFLERFREINATAEVRVLLDDRNGWPRVLQDAISGPAHIALRAASQPLHRMPARRAQRVDMPHDAKVLINGSPVRLVNLSPLGAQVLSPKVVKPGEHLSIRLPNEPRITAKVVWSTFEPSTGGGAQYRAGLAFEKSRTS